MKITDVKTIRLRATIPTEGQVFSRSGVRNTRSTTLVHVETGEGVSGIGSASGNGELIEVIVAKVLKRVRNFWKLQGRRRTSSFSQTKR